jgi:hypothetical protein
MNSYKGSAISSYVCTLLCGICRRHHQTARTRICHLWRGKSYFCIVNGEFRVAPISHVSELMVSIVSRTVCMVSVCGVNSDYLILVFRRAVMFGSKIFPEYDLYSFVRVYPEVISICQQLMHTNRFYNSDLPMVLITM